MRMAILSDIHGNTIALEAALADVESQGGVDEYWVLGDLVALGADPIGVLNRLSELDNASFTRGNTDRYTTTGERPAPTLEEAATDPQLLPRLVMLSSTFGWTQGIVTQAGWLDWLAALDLELRRTLPDGTRLLGVHAAPGRDDGNGFRPATNDRELEQLFGGCEADLILVGHTHVAVDAEHNGMQIVNLGSISNPFPPDLRASYVILEADANGFDVQRRRVEYDRVAAVEAVQRVKQPAAETITALLKGEIRPLWEKV